ncbi:uncharacterized protein HMPREF1541_00655 [Cyphellophora europaea CBS 101466]|uniref:Uncharacterized protein n=1 Tax=Cyphellophora europaea (strain CBS 101466) TaxID=1220924 RepID=W2SCX9_CYPE1|nr:uncharacterized protein HMPREF1541_00655 [Cyphellophora europaea CBS 101466]ETN46470.1 hypothetical protein HMPREF1541_00655 [Cyphellophora europaea CBS 101466]
MATPTSSGLRWSLTIVYCGLSAVALYYIRLGPTSTAVGKHFEKIYEGAEKPFPGRDTVLRRHYTGIKACDEFASMLVAAFLNGPAGWVEGIRLQQAYFLLSFTAVLAAMSVESARKRNTWASITFTSLWAFFYQTVGGAVIIPLYYLCYTWIAARPDYWTASRDVPVAKAKTLLPALVFGFLMPTLVTWYPHNAFDIDTLQKLVAFWQITPFVVNILWLIFSTIYRAFHGKQIEQKHGDVRPLTVVYLLSFVVSAAAHLATLYLCYTSADPTISFDFVFTPRQVQNPSMAEGLHFTFIVDYWIIFISTMIWCLQAQLEITALGRTNLRAFQTVVYIVIGSIVLGPGAVLSAVWWWRESRIDPVPDPKKSN